MYILAGLLKVGKCLTRNIQYFGCIEICGQFLVKNWKFTSFPWNVLLPTYASGIWYRLSLGPALIATSYISVLLTIEC